MKPILAILLVAMTAKGMDWNALGAVESGNNDYAVGRAGERGFCQISVKVVREWHFDGSRLTNHEYALECAEKVMDARVAQFGVRTPFSRDFTLALLWRCPARRLKPSQNDREYAERYANLAEKDRQDMQNKTPYKSNTAQAPKTP